MLELMRKKKITRLAAALLMVGCLLTGCRQETPPTEESVPDITESLPPETRPEMSVSDLLRATLTLKGDLEDTVDLVKEQDLAGAREKLTGILEKTAIVRASLEGTMENLGGSMPSMVKELENMQGLLDLVDQAAEKLLLPGLDHMEANPLGDMSTEAGVDMKPLWGYVDFLEGLMPELAELVDMAGGVDLSLVDKDGKLAGYLETAAELTELYAQDDTLFQNLRNMLGAQGDRLYVIAPQASAEIRASGGFPGAIGSIRIEDGILILGEFDRVYDMLASKTPSAGNVTNVENRLFHSGMLAPRDADYCPDFERVGYIFALGFEARQRVEVDGVISMTPVLVQRLLKATESEIRLFDGNILNGSNAVKVLQHDIYFQYFGADLAYDRKEVTDELFVDAAKQTFQVLMDNMSIGDILRYVKVAEESFADRTLMLWMKDEQEQELVRAMDWNAGLNKDPQKPEAGIYYSCNVPSKMGWFLIREVEVGQRVKNEDGSYTYPITVTLSNDMTDEEFRVANSYITGNAGGQVMGTIYFFAPAGGTVSDFETSKGKVTMDVYQDLQLGYMRGANVGRKEHLVISYKVTTAPGVEAELELSMTPTVQDYH